MITRRFARPLSAASSSSSSSWVCSSCARSSFLPLKPLQPQLRRNLHKLPPLGHFERFTTDGVPGLLSDKGFDIAWTQHMSMLVGKLNELTAGEPTEHRRPKEIVTEFARDPLNASLFNHASMIENTRIFFEGLSTFPRHIDEASVSDVKASLEQTFGSIDTLRTAMLDTAAAMFGPGFVWLVWARDVASAGNGAGALSRRNGDWRILATYNAGTPYPEAGFREQGLDMNTTNAPTFDSYLRSQPVNTVGKMGPYSSQGIQDQKIPPGATQVQPVLCVSTWQHVYLQDYGVQGKRAYLAAWWNAIDWDKVQTIAPGDAKSSRSYFGRQ